MRLLNAHKEFKPDFSMLTRKDILHHTQKRRMHLAIELGSKKALHNQLMHARFCVRLLKRVAKHFPNAEILFLNCAGADLMKRQKFAKADHTIEASFMVIENNKIIRTFCVMHAVDNCCVVFAESYKYKSKSASWDSYQKLLLESPCRSRTDKAFNLIKKTPYTSFAHLQ